MKHDLRFHPYKIQVVQALHSQGYNARLRFCQHMLILINGNEDRVHNLWMNNEAYFHLSVLVNKQNFRYWVKGNPQHLHEKPLYSQKVTI